MGDGNIVWDAVPKVAPLAPPVKVAAIRWDAKPVVNVPAPGVSLASSQQLLTQSQGHGDAMLLQADIANANGDIRDDEKQWLYDNRTKITPEQFNQSLNVFSNKAQGQNFWNQNEYYYDKNGLPQPIKPGESAPEYATVASVWGSQQQAQDDNALTTLGKTAFNGFIDVAKLPATLTNLAYNFFGGKGTTGLGNYITTAADNMKFNIRESKDLVSSQAFNSMSDFFNSANWNPSTQGFAKFFGSAAGFLGQLALLGGAGEAGEVGTQAPSLVSKLLPSGRLLATNSLVSLNSAYDQSTAAGLDGRERAAVSLISALGQGYVMSVFAPSALQKVAGATMKSGVDAISKDAVDAFVKAGAKITPESLDAAYKATLDGTLTFAQKLPVIAREGLKGGTMMAGAQLMDDAVRAIDAKISGKPQASTTAAEDFKKYFDSFFSGAVLGIGGSLVEGTATKEAAKSNMAYAYIRDGKEADLLHNLKSLYDNKAISQQDYDNSVFRVNAYKKYFTETADVPMNDETRRRVFDLTWTDENIKQRIATLEADQTMTPALKEAKLKDLRDQSKSHVDQIAELLKPKPVEKIVDKKAETGINKGTQEATVFEHRHANTESDTQGKTSGWTNEPLNEKGIKQADVLAEQAKKNGITHIITTPIERGLETAKRIGAKLGIPVKVNENLKTWNIGKFNDALKKDFPERYYVEHPDERVPEGESFNEFIARDAKGQQEIDALHAQHQIDKSADVAGHTLVIGHSRNIRWHDSLEEANGNVEKAKEIYLRKAEKETGVTPMPEEKPAPELKMTGEEEKGATKKTNVERRKEIVETVIKHTPSLEGFKHHAEPTEERAVLAGGRSAKDMPARNKIKVGDVLTVKEEKSTKKGYHHFLTVYDKDGKQVGTITYKSKSKLGELSYHDKLIEKLLKEGKEVKLIATKAKMATPGMKVEGQWVKMDEPVKEILYQVISREKGAEKPVEKIVEKKPETVTPVESQKAEKTVEKPKGKVENIIEARRKVKEEIRKHEPQTFREKVMQDLVLATKEKPLIKSADYTHETGFGTKDEKGKFTRGGEEFRQAKDSGFHGEKGQSLDRYVYGQHEDFNDIASESEAKNTVTELINEYGDKGGKARLRLDLLDIIHKHEGGGDAELMARFGTTDEAEIQKMIDEEKTKNPQLNEVDTLEKLRKYADENDDYGTWIDEQARAEAESVIGGLDEESDTGTGDEDRAGKTGEEEVKPFPKDSDPIELLRDVTTADELNRVIDFARENKKSTRAFVDAVIAKHKEIIAGGLELKGMAETAKEPLASSDPELFDRIVSDLKVKFPNVEVFSDRKKFQDFIDRNFPGKKLEINKIGAAIANAVFIDPERARQSTALHEFAHIYWDMLPKNDATKRKLLSLFPDEESAIIAIGQLGTEAKALKMKGTALSNFIQAVRDFYAKVKQMLFPKKMSLEEQQKAYAKVMAERVFSNIERVDVTESGGDGPIKYMEDDVNEKQRQVVKDLQSIAEEFDFNADEHTYTNKATGENFPSVTQALDVDKLYKYSGPQGERREALKNTGKGIHSVVENIIREGDVEKAISDSGLNITKSAIDSLKRQLKPVLDRLKAKGQMLPETIFANTDFKIAGTSDLPVVDSDGVVHIYDVKTSMSSTEDAKYTQPMAKGKATKMDLQGAQLAMYARLIESDDPSLGNEGKTIGDMGIIPIHYEIDKEGKITKVAVEKVVNFSYDDYRGEADRILNQHRQLMEDHDRNVAESMTEQSEQEFLDGMGLNLREAQDELKALQKLPFDRRGEREGELQRAIELMQDRQQQYRRDFKKIKDIVGTKDFSKLGHAELVDMYNTLMSYGNMRDNLYIKRILSHIAFRMKDEQEKMVGEGKKGEQDIKKHQVMLMAPSDIPDKNPVAQSFVKKYLTKRRASDSEIQSMYDRIHKLARAVVSEKSKDENVLKRASQLFYDATDKEGYFKDLFGNDVDGNPTLKASNDRSLTKNQSELLKLWEDLSNPYREKQGASERGWWQGFFPQATPAFWEAFHNEGLFGSLVGSIHRNDPEGLAQQKMDFLDPTTKAKVNIPYGEVVERLDRAKGKNIITESIAALKLKQAHKRALEEYVKAGGVITEGSGTKYFVSRTGELMSKYQREFTGRTSEGLNPVRAMTDYLQDMIHTKNMQEVMPEMEAVKRYYDDKAHVNMSEFLKMLEEGDILGKRFTGKFGTGVDNLSRFMVGWTFLNQITFNLHSGVIHAFSRKWNQWRADGGAKLHKGESRYFGNFRQSLGIMKHYDIVPKSVGMDEMAGYNAKNLFSKLGVANISIGEHWVRGSSFFANLTDAEYKALTENFDNKGNIIDPKKQILSQQRLVELDKTVNDVQGKYGFADKRMYKHYPLMRAGMQYRGYIPDFVKDRIGKQYTDAFGKTHKGAYLSVPYILRDVKMLFTDFRNYRDSKDIDIVNNKKNMREIAGFAATLGVYAMVNGTSKEDRRNGQYCLDALGHMTGFLNPQTWTFTAQQPIPSLATMANFTQAFSSLFAKYATDGKYGKKGDYMFPGKIINVLPYNHTVRDVYQSMRNPDYNGK